MFYIHPTNAIQVSCQYIIDARVSVAIEQACQQLLGHHQYCPPCKRPPPEYGPAHLCMHVGLHIIE